MSETLAVDSGTPVRTKPWPKWPIYDESDEQALIKALHSGVWGVNGKLKTEFEQQYAALHQSKYAVTCINGTVALQIALVAAGFEPGDELITTPYTFIASGLAAMALGVVPVFVDIEPGTHNIDPDKIEAAITSKTRGIMPVHIGGRPCDMDRINEIARRRKLVVVEDAAQAWLAAWRGTPVGAIGIAGGFSFQSSKNLTTGEGGIVLTNDEATYQRAWSYHNCGRTQGGAWYAHDFPGLNYRLSEFHAALLLSQLARLPEQQATRFAAMKTLHEGLRGIPGILIPDDDPRVTSHACHIYMVRLDREIFPGDKMPFIKALQAEGIPAHPGYTTPLYSQGIWKWYGERSTGAGTKAQQHWGHDFYSYKLPVCEELCASTIWIKQEMLLAGPSEMQDVVRAFEKVSRAFRSGRNR